MTGRGTRGLERVGFTLKGAVCYYPTAKTSGELTGGLYWGFLVLRRKPSAAYKLDLTN